MENIIVDYVWVDGQKSQLKSKTKILHVDMRRFPDVVTYMGSTPRILSVSDLEKIPNWKDNLNVLRPVKLYKDSDRYIVLCEVSKCPYNNQSEEKIFYGESKREDNLVNICKTKGFILKKIS